MRQKYLYVCLLFLFVALPIVASAASFHFGENYSLKKGETINDDLYIAGGNTAIAGDVNGDLFIGGGNVFIGNDVARDVFAVGGTINVIGSVGENLRIVGGNIVFSGEVGRDLSAAGGDVKILPNSNVLGNMSIAGGNIAISGVIDGDLKIAGGYIELDNHVKGSVYVTGDTVVIGDNAVIDGSLRYSSARQATISENAIIKGDVFFKEIQVKPIRERFLPTLWGTWTIVKFIVILIAALVMNTVLRSISALFVAQAINNFWKNALRGFIFLVVVPVGLILVTLTFVGAPFLIIGAAVWILLGTLAWIYGPIVLGTLVTRLVHKREEEKTIEISWKTILIGVFLYVLLGYIPFVGVLFKFIVSMVALGSVFKVFYDKFVSAR